MPRRRATRKGPTSKPRQPEGDEGKDLTQEEKNLKLQTYLADFDTEVERRTDEIKAKAAKICSELQNMMRMELMKIPKATREMKFSDFMAQGGSIQLAVLEATKAALSEVPPMPAEIVSVQSEKKCRKPPFACDTIEEEESGENDEVGTQDVKVKKPPRPKRKAAVLPSASSSRSTRRTKILVEQTPACQIRGACAYMDTPMVTPKIDPRLIATPGLSRLPKQREATLTYVAEVSEVTGSPIKTDNVLIVVNNGEVQVVDSETGRANPVPIDMMKKSDRTKFMQLKSFLQNLSGLVKGGQDSS